MTHTPLSDFELYYSACAAAPEMLEALEEVLELTESIPVCPFCQCYGAGFHRAGCTTERIKAALRKARGEDA